MYKVIESVEKGFWEDIKVLEEETGSYLIYRRLEDELYYKLNKGSIDGKKFIIENGLLKKGGKGRPTKAMTDKLEAMKKWSNENIFEK